MQEILKVHPVAIEIARVPKKGDVLPLSKPLVGVSGKAYNELPVPARTATYISTVGYNLYVSLSGACPPGSCRVWDRLHHLQKQGRVGAGRL